MDRCKHVSRLRLGEDHSTLNTQKWQCAEPGCGAAESLWACLKCPHVSCGRDLHHHALLHHQASRHPLAMDVRELDVFCFTCGDFALNDNAEGDLKLLRGALSTIRNPHRRSLRSAAAAAGGEGGAWMESEGMMRPPSQVALWHHRKVLLERVMRRWSCRRREEEEKRNPKPESEPEQQQQQQQEEQRERREVKRRLTEDPAGSGGVGSGGATNSSSVSASNCGPPRKSARLLTQAPRQTLALVPVKFRDPPERLPSSTAASSQTQTSLSSSSSSTTNVQRPSALSLRNSNSSPSPKPKPRRYHASSLSSLTTQQRRQRRLAPGVTGLRNLGNTCYMNSILQVLSHLQKFRECFLTLDLCETEELLAKTKTSQTGGGGGGGITGGEMVGSSAGGTLGYGLGRGAGSSSSGSGNSSGGGGVGGDGGSGAATGAGGGGGGGGGTAGGQAGAPGAAGSNNNSKETSSSQRTSARQRMSLCHELHTLFRVMWSGRWSLVSPFAMLHSVWNLIPAFRGYAQQDAQEFLCELLDKVQQELESNGSKRRILMPMTQRKLSKQVLKVLNTIFHGQLLSQVTCLSCKHKSNTVEPFWDLSLEFPERYHSGQKASGSLGLKSCSLTEMLAKFTETEALEGRIYACNHCNKKRRKSSHKPLILTEACKQLLIYRLPQVLRLHLKRFRWSGRNHREKIGVHVAFDQVLNIQPYCCRDSANASATGTASASGVHRQGFTYDLSAVVMHHGKGFGSGHYTAYCYNTEGGFWVHCNDSVMNVCSVEEVCNTQAYILFYTQRSA
ncbi:ubiquitin carboxyl-terminal hydrolase 49 [Engraulis encrasicolus]|uniref:ubiquitin carboxyl-terminal hydrolase 49 n=1 Tax=Engraulis encrasicolus TaxID=184585 RepID=UPI002FD2E325